MPISVAKVVMSPSSGSLVLNYIAKCSILDRMMTRVLGARSLARDLGSWQEESGRRPAYRALADGIRLLVHDGRVPLGVALPSERELATVLELSRTTITSSYSVLRDEGI